MENGVPALLLVVKELSLAPELAPNLLQLTVEQNVTERKTKLKRVMQTLVQVMSINEQRNIKFKVFDEVSTDGEIFHVIRTSFFKSG